MSGNISKEERSYAMQTNTIMKMYLTIYYTFILSPMTCVLIKHWMALPRDAGDGDAGASAPPTFS